MTSRRHFFLSAAVALAGCSKGRKADQQVRQYPVSILKAKSYSVDLSNRIRHILQDHQVAVRGKRIILKPNLVEFDPNRPINTHPVFVAAALDAFRSLGAASVRIAEGPGHRRATLDMADAAGYFDAIARFEDDFTDLNLDDIQRVQLHQSFSTLHELYLPKTVLDCDLLVSLAKMKTHHWAGATLSMKNLFGVVPGAVYGWPKNILHWAGINECVADLHYLFPNQFSLVDGIEGMHGNGPIQGSAIHAGVIVGGSHAPSVDATCCRIMQLAPGKIGYLQLVAKRSKWTPDAVLQRGERIQDVATRFDLPSELQSLRG